MECQEHGQEKTLVCVTCNNKPLCSQCFDDHEEGHSIQSLKKAKSQPLQQLNDKSTSYSQRTSDIRSEISKTQTIQKKQDILERKSCDKIKAQGKLLHNAIDEAVGNLIKVCEERKQKNASALQEHENSLSSKNTELTNNQSKINKLQQSNDFSEVNTTPGTVKPRTVEDISLESLEFETSEINKKIIGTILGQTGTPDDEDLSDFLGSLHLQSAALDSIPGSSKCVLTTVSTINSEYDCAENIHPSVPGHAWIRWYRQNEVQLTDGQGLVKQSVKFKKQITGITTTPDNRLLVCGAAEKCIYQVVYGSEPSVFINTTLFPIDICTTCSGDVLVSMVDSTDFKTRYNSRRIVSRYSSSGHHLSDDAEYDRFGDRLFVRPYRLAVNNTNTAVAVVNEASATSSHLVLLDTALNLKLRYDSTVTPANNKYKPDTDVKFYILDTIFTPNGNILLTEQHSKSVLMLNSECQLLKPLWRDDLRPVSLCLHDDGELWCVLHKKGGGVIKIIKPSTHK